MLEAGRHFFLRSVPFGVLCNYNAKGSNKFYLANIGINQAKSRMKIFYILKFILNMPPNTKRLCAFFGEWETRQGRVGGTLEFWGVRRRGLSAIAEQFLKILHLQSWKRF